jgi:O-Antigen ligase/PDZ domain
MDESRRGSLRPSENPVFRITEGTITVSLVMYALFAPHSIAITQGSYLIGLVAWIVQSAWRRRVDIKGSPMDVALLGFFACAVLSSFFSYDPLVSIKGLKSPAFFLAFYFVSTKVKSLRFAAALAMAVVISCLVNVAYSGAQLAKGRGLRIDSLQADGPFARRHLQVGDVIQEADGEPVTTVEDLSRLVDAHRGLLRIKYTRSESVLEAAVSRRAIRRSPGAGPERLGLTTSPGRNFRIMGFYSHYETYAEVLQIVAALALGAFISLSRKWSMRGVALALSLFLFTGALVLTSTRAPIAGLAIGASVMALASLQRKTLVVVAVAIVILFPTALYYLERTRGITFFDPQEASTAYRIEVWQEALGIVRTHPLLGIGKGSEAKLKEQLGLYDNGRLPPGHFHSTPIQIATWWGLPALIFYFAVMSILVLEAWKVANRLRNKNQRGAYGLALGGIGGIVAFNFSSLFHFNFGDGEVVMMLWLLSGLVFAVRRISDEQTDDASTDSRSLPAQPDSHRNRPRPPEEAAEPSAQAAGVRRS